MIDPDGTIRKVLLRKRAAKLVTKVLDVEHADLLRTEEDLQFGSRGDQNSFDIALGLLDLALPAIQFGKEFRNLIEIEISEKPEQSSQSGHEAFARRISMGISGIKKHRP